MQDYTKLLVWQKARRLTVSISEAVRDAPLDHAPGLRAQLMRAALSIGTNVCEGAGRATRPDFARFVSMATASASEVEHHLTVAGDLGLLEHEVVDRLVGQVIEVRRMLCGLLRVLGDRHKEVTEGRH